MSQSGCKCGYVMSFNTGEETYDLALIPNDIIDEIGCMIENKTIHASEDYFQLIDFKKRDVIECPHCGRLYLEESPNRFCSYVKETFSN